MKIDIAPSTFVVRQETGLIAMLARLLHPSHSVSMVRCNGILGVCHRDEETSWHRSFDSCLSCMSERSALGAWTGASLSDLSPYLLPEDIERTRRWVNELSTEQILNDSFDGCVPWEWAKQYFVARFSTARPVATNKQHDFFVRKFILSVLRIRISARRYLFANKPDLIIVSDSNDLVSAALKEVAADFGIGLFSVLWRNDLRINQIENYHTNKLLDSDVVVSNVTELRSEPNTWPSDLIERLNVVCKFMGIENQALAHDRRLRSAG
jgi:hypothetical protein